MPRAVLGKTELAVVDLETTGIYPGGHDRVIEIGLVRLSPAFDVLAEFDTLVNPRRDLGRSDIHGISGAEIAAAPDFEEIAGDLSELLADAVVVGHHVRFDLGFLSAEYARVGAELPPVPGLCTMRLAFELAEVPSRSLAQCCLEAGIRPPKEHAAIEDARATSWLLHEYLVRARRRGAVDLTALGCDVLEVLPRGWSVLPRAGRRVCRQEGARHGAERRSFLGKLVARMPAGNVQTPRAHEYLAVLDRVLEDRLITRQEAEGLIVSAESWGMGRAEVTELHRTYLASLVATAMADGQLSPSEQADLSAVSDMLALHATVLAALLEQPSRPAPSAGGAPARITDDLRGKSVCFTGELLACRCGERITREMAERLASDAGLDVRSSVTKKLDILVVADPDSQSEKARKARSYGIRILSDRAFWPKLGIQVD